MMAPVIETDDEIEAVHALDKALSELRSVQATPYNWKWVVIALHNALQGFMVLALRFTNPALVARVPQPLGKWNDTIIAAYNQRTLVRDLPAKSLPSEPDEARDAYMAYVERTARALVPPAEFDSYLHHVYDSPVSLLDYQLIGFLDLFGRIQSPKYKPYMQAPGRLPYQATQEQRKDVALLNQLRNEYIHFTPKTLVLHLDAIVLTRVATTCLTVIRFLIDDGGIVWRHNGFEEGDDNLREYARGLASEMQMLVATIAAAYGSSK